MSNDELLKILKSEMDHFIDTHQNPAPVVIPIDFTEDQYGTKHYIYTP